MGPRDKRQLSAGSVGVPRQGGPTINRWAGHWISARWVGAPKEGGVRPGLRPPGATLHPLELGVLTSGLCALQEVQTPRGSNPAWHGVVCGCFWGSIPLLCPVFTSTTLWFMVDQCHCGRGSAVSRRGCSHPDPSVLRLHPPGPLLLQCSWSQPLRWPPCLQGLYLQPSLWPSRMFF